MTFPSASRIVYSTCSVEPEENEEVVIRALRSEDGISHRWRLLERERQASGLRQWEIRGNVEACRAAMAAAGGAGSDVIGRHQGVGDEEQKVANSCIRCEKGGSRGTIGFFVACLVRDGAGNGDNGGGVDVDDEWKGFSDDD
jgi:putative methyltransferase